MKGKDGKRKSFFAGPRIRSREATMRSFLEKKGHNESEAGKKIEEGV